MQQDYPDDRKIALPLEMNIYETLQYLGLESSSIDEFVARVNTDRLPVRVKSDILAQHNSPIEGSQNSYLVSSIGFHGNKDAPGRFGGTIKKYLCEILSLKKKPSSKAINVPKGSLLICTKDLFSERDEMVEYLEQTPSFNPTFNPNKKPKHQKRERIDKTRELKLKEYLLAKAKELGSSETSPKKIYELINKPSIPQLNKELNVFAPDIFKINKNTEEPFKNFWRSQSIIPVLAYGTGKGRGKG